MLNLSHALTVLLVVLGGSVISCSDGGEIDQPVAHDNVNAAALPISQGLVGRVAGDDGQPLEGAFIVPVSLDEEPPPIPEIAIVSESDGKYEWPLRPGEYEIAVTLDGYQEAKARVSVRVGEVATLDFTLTR